MKIDKILQKITKGKYMKLRFKEQQYQIDAVNAICNIFDRQPKRDLIKNIFDKEILQHGLIKVN